MGGRNPTCPRPGQEPTGSREAWTRHGRLSTCNGLGFACPGRVGTAAGAGHKAHDSHIPKIPSQSLNFGANEDKSIASWSRREQLVRAPGHRGALNLLHNSHGGTALSTTSCLHLGRPGGEQKQSRESMGHVGLDGRGWGADSRGKGTFWGSGACRPSLLARERPELQGGPTNGHPHKHLLVWPHTPEGPGGPSISAPRPAGSLCPAFALSWWECEQPG